MRGRINADDTTPRDDRHDWWGVVLDATDPQVLARFYAAILDWEVSKSEPNWATVNPSSGVGYLGFQRSEGYRAPVWPNADGQQQMMLHLDFEVSDLDAAVAHAVELGARIADFQPQKEVRVMLDPDGHPFCLYIG
jgi:catechol 2,3-dioxygenase-like lactoylglutathione lyase family enzyme